MEYQYTASGGTEPYSFSIVAGALPPGLSMDSTGLVTGTPTTAGVYHWTVQVVDAIGRQCTLEDSAYVMDLVGDPPDGQVSIAYSYTMHGVSGQPPYTYALTGGLLPDGLTLSSAGVISGVPTTEETQTFEITVTDSNGVTQAYTYNITITALETELLPLAATGYLVSDTGADASCSIEFIIYNDGTYTVRRFVGTSVHTFVTANWITTPGAGIGDLYEVRFVGTKKTVGNTTGTDIDAVDSGWLALSTQQGDSCAASASSASGDNQDMSQQINYTISFRKIADPLPVVDSPMIITAEASI